MALNFGEMFNKIQINEYRTGNPAKKTKTRQKPGSFKNPARTPKTRQMPGLPGKITPLSGGADRHRRGKFFGI